MAIFAGIECNVTIDGENMVEYECPPDHDASVSNNEPIAGPYIEKYIESQPDQNFAVRVSYPQNLRFKRFSTVTSHVHIDGVKMAATWEYKKDVKKHDTTVTKFEGVERNNSRGSEILKFRFSKLTTAQSRPEVDVKQLARLGDIVVKVFRATPKSKLKVSTRLDGIASPEFAEKQAKGRAIDAFTSLDVPVATGERRRTSKMRYEDKPLIEFIFHYRGKEVLQQLGVLEIPLNQRPLEGRDPSDMTLDEMRELLRRKEDVIRQQEDTEKLMKKRLREADARRNLLTLEAMKRAPSPNPRRRDHDSDDEEVQIVKRAKKDRRIEIVELD